MGSFSDPALILDGTVLYDSLTQSFFMKEGWSSHDPATLDNFVTLTNAGNGSSTTSTYIRTLLSGTGAAGSSIYKSVVFGQTSPVTNIVFNCKVGTLVAGAGVARRTIIGLKFNFALIDNTNIAAFEQIADDTWQCNTDGTLTAIAAIAAQDALTIIVRGSTTKYYVNGALVASHAVVPTAPYSFGASVIATAATVVTARELALKYMSFERYGVP